MRWTLRSGWPWRRSLWVPPRRATHSARVAVGIICLLDVGRGFAACPLSGKQGRHLSVSHVLVQPARRARDHKRPCWALSKALGRAERAHAASGEGEKQGKEGNSMSSRPVPVPFVRLLRLAATAYVRCKLHGCGSKEHAGSSPVLGKSLQHASNVQGLLWLCTCDVLLTGMLGCSVP